MAILLSCRLPTESPLWRQLGKQREASDHYPNKHTKRTDTAVPVLYPLPNYRKQKYPATHRGFYGSCPFLEQSKYLDFRYFARLPTHHALLLGLCKDFLVNVLRWASGGKQRPAAQCVDVISLSPAKVKIARAVFYKGAFTMTTFKRSIVRGLFHRE